MSIQAQIEAERKTFAPARDKFEQIIEWLKRQEAETLSSTEQRLQREILEFGRLLLQARLDILYERERGDLAKRRPEQVKIRVLPRQRESTFGRVVQRRYGLKEAEKPSHFAMDQELNAPADMYSHPLRQEVAEQVLKGSFDHAIAQIERTTAGHVPKRQAEQLAVRASQDVEAYYAQRTQPANDTLSDSALLMMSSDGAGVKMVRKGLREETRRAADKAEQQAEQAVKGDPTAKKPVGLHETRRAVVTAVWEQEPHQRTVHDVVANLDKDPDPERRKKARGPRPQNKRVTASVAQDQRERIKEMFDEADRRDPERTRATAVLVDGDEHQTSAILREGRERGRSLTLVLDLLHAMHYLWLAAMAATARNKAEAQAMVTHWTIMLLTGEPARLVATVRGTATRLGLRGKARETVDEAADYLLKRTPFIHYAKFIAAGLPIASGVIEGACRYIVRDRMAITGARWALQVAEAVLKLRAVHASGDWDDYWDYHLNQEAFRNYANAA